MMRGVGHWAVAVRAPATGASAAPATGASAAPATGASAAPATGASAAPATGASAAPATGASAAAQPLGPISVTTCVLAPASLRNRVYRLPVIRGVVALGGSLAIGMRALGIAARRRARQGYP